MAVGLLDRPEIGEDPQRILAGTGGKEAAGGLDEVARPDQVIAAEVLVALAEAPRDRQAGDRRPREIERPVSGEHGRAHAIGVETGWRCAVERLELLLPRPPAGDIFPLGRVEAGHHAGDRIVGGLRRGWREPQCKQGRRVARRKSDLAGQRHIAVFGALIGGFQPAGIVELPPAV
jgi:hypothetical protein